MCDTATLSTIEEVVRSKVQSSEMFTAFDVTLAVQAALKANGSFDANEHRHRHLKNDVHNIVESFVSGGQYSRNLQNVGAPTNAFVYYPNGGDPATYVPIARNDGAAPVANDPYTITVPARAPIQPLQVAAAVAAQISPVPQTDNDGDGLDNVGRTPDARGSIIVPSYLLRSVNFVFNDSAYVRADGNTLVVSHVTPTDGSTYTTYTVDHSCNVRITKAVLEYAGLSNAASFDFERVGDTIVVKEHS